MRSSNFSSATALRFAIALLPLAAAWPQQALADRPACHVHNGSPYCQYSGLVKHAYVNASNQVLLYFDTAFSTAADINISGVTVLNACMVLGNDKPSFAKMFYASTLMAQASGKTVSVQMWTASDGYPLCDRIWVNN